MEALTARSPLWIWVTISFRYTSAYALTSSLNLKNKSHPGEGVSKGNARLGVSVQKSSPVGKPLRLQSAKAEKTPGGYIRDLPAGRSLMAAFFPGVSLQKQRNPDKNPLQTI